MGPDRDSVKQVQPLFRWPRLSFGEIRQENNWNVYWKDHKSFITGYKGLKIEKMLKILEKYENLAKNALFLYNLINICDFIGKN